MVKRRLFQGAVTLSVLGVAVAAWSFFIEPNRLRANEVTIALPRWPATLSGLKVAVISDLHVGAPFVDAEKVQQVRARIDEWHPDLVLLAGDLVVGHEPGATVLSPEAAAEPLRGWHAPLGVFAVLGNHDWWTDGPRVAAALEDVGVRVLANSSVAVDSARGRFWLTGLEDVWTRKTDASAALSMVTDDAPVIAFTHNPDVFPGLPARFAIVVAGHTHGGQVRLPLIGAPVVPSKYEQRYAAGVVVEEGRTLFVTTGIGTSIMPVRLGVVPEVALLTLVAR